MSTAERRRAHADHGPLFWCAFVAGWAMIGFGVWTAFVRSGAVHPLSLGAWIVGLALVHDLLVAPAISAAAVVLVPRLPRRDRAVVLGAVVVSAVLVLLSLPPLLGDPAGNDTILVRNYPAGLAAAIIVTWSLAAIWVVAARARARRR